MSTFKPVGFILDKRRVCAAEGETIWQVARRHGIDIPHLCLSTEPDFQPVGACRICVVEIEGRPTLQPSCAVHPSEEMVVHTSSARAQHARRLVMELTLAEATPIPGSECMRLAEAMGITRSRFALSDVHPEDDPTHPGIYVSLDACVRCLRCVQACREVEVNGVIGVVGRGERSKIAFDCDDPMGESSCVGCGSCAQVCPTGAIRFKGAELG